jgi:hypothetical protein
MSLAVDKLNPITVHDPRVCNMSRIYPVLKGGSDKNANFFFVKCR